MDMQKVDMYLTANAKFFPAEKMAALREQLMAADDSKFAVMQSCELKDPTTLLLISIFLGGFGVDRFMLGDTGMGVLKLLTGGVCGVLAIIDWFTVQNKTKEMNYNKIAAIL